MYRALLAIIALSVLSLSVGCQTKEIKPTTESFKADKEAAKQGMSEAREKMNQFMPDRMKNMQQGQ